MKKIDGTLFAPVEGDDREKLYVETVPEAVVTEDGSTLRERIDKKSNGIEITDEKPDKPCLWIKPNGIDTETYFDFSDVKMEIPDDPTKIHTLRTPADRTGVREIVYPLTDAKGVKVSEDRNLNDVLNDYDMGFEVGRDKPDHKALWGMESYKTAEIDDFGKTEEVLLLNDFLGTEVTIDGTEYSANEYMFNIDGDDMVVLDPSTNLVEMNSTTPNKSCLWIQETSN